MTQPRRPLVAALSFAALLAGPALGHAQGWSDVPPPPGRYLPEPTYREPSIDDLANGNGRLHFSGQWRHWGDSRNSGELVQMLVAPNQVLGGGRAPNGLPQSRFCNDHPERC